MRVLDGGLSTALEAQGADLSGPLWTARLLAEEPERIAAAHRAFYLAGAEVVITASYQASTEGFTAAAVTDPAALITRSVALARDVRDSLGGDRLVAASVGPYGAVLADGSEYRGRYGISAARLRTFHRPRLELLAEAGPDLIAVETIPDADEAEVLVALLDEVGLPAWLSYSVRGDTTCAGQPLAEAYAVLAGSNALVAAGVNCSAQVDVLEAVRTAVAVTACRPWRTRTVAGAGIRWPRGGRTAILSTSTWSSGGWRPAWSTSVAAAAPAPPTSPRSPGASPRSGDLDLDLLRTAWSSRRQTDVLGPRPPDPGDLRVLEQARAVGGGEGRDVEATHVQIVSRPAASRPVRFVPRPGDQGPCRDTALRRRMAVRR